MKSIATDTAAKHGVTLADLQGPNKARPISDFRQEAMFAMRTFGPWSYPQIGKFFTRDHTTAVHGVKAHLKRLAETKPDRNAEGVAARIAVKIEAAMRDSAGWAEISDAERARLVETAQHIGRMLG